MICDASREKERKDHVPNFLSDNINPLYQGAGHECQSWGIG